MIGGVEFPLIASDPEEAFEAVVRLCRLRWPDGVFLDADESELIPLAESELGLRPPSREFFVFSDRDLAERWDDLGPCPETWNRMFHFLCKPAEIQDGAESRVTVVVDEITPDVSRFLRDLQNAFLRSQNSA